MSAPPAPSCVSTAAGGPSAIAKGVAAVQLRPVIGNLMICTAVTPTLNHT